MKKKTGKNNIARTALIRLSAYRGLKVRTPFYPAFDRDLQRTVAKLQGLGSLLLGGPSTLQGT